VAFNKKEVKKGHVSIKCWDLGGQPRFRSMWERYCRDVNAIIFVVDAADKEALPVAKEELHMLLEQQSLGGIPLLVLGNKSDLRGKMSVDELIEGLELKKVVDREISCYGVSAKEETNLEAVLQVSRGCVYVYACLVAALFFLDSRLALALALASHLPENFDILIQCVF
jgi:ADP-ribosylation factor-like protein 8